MQALQLKDISVRREKSDCLQLAVALWRCSVHVERAWVLADTLPDEPVTNGKLFITLYAGNIPIFENTFLLCDLITCPIEKGPYVQYWSHYVAEDTPPVRSPSQFRAECCQINYELKLEANAMSGNTILCVKIFAHVDWSWS
jgi:hypothetical protein